MEKLLASAPLLCLAISGCGLFASKPPAPQVPDDLWTILSGVEAENMRGPCSRPFPEGMGASWQPSPADVQRFERLLPAAIDAEFPFLGKLSRPDRFVRQYAGFLRHGRPVIYVNGIGLRGGARELELGQDWRSRFVNICDGGRGFFGAVYDIQKDAIDSFVFNGSV